MVPFNRISLDVFHIEFGLWDLGAVTNIQLVISLLNQGTSAISMIVMMRISFVPCLLEEMMSVVQAHVS